MIPASRTTFTYWPGHSDRSAFGMLARVAIVPDGRSCKVVLFRWPDDPAIASQLRALLADDEICAVDRGGQ